ncbi:MAG: ABC transporter substrate-binding protein [Pseudomonadota bacterium]
MPTSRISRRAFNTKVAMFMAATVAGPAVHAETARPERSRIGIAVASRAAISVLPLALADQLGYFRSAGLEVDITEHGSGERLLDDGVFNGSDVISGSFEQTLLLQARGLFYQAFVLQARTPQVAMGVSIRALPLYRTIADLRGRRLGISSAGSATSLVTQRVLARGGLALGDVTLVPVGSGWQAANALRGGFVDALSNLDPVMTQLELRGDVRIVGDTRTLKGTQEIFGGPMPASCLYASQEFIQKNPHTCQALADGVVHALKWLRTAGPSDIIRNVPEGFLLGDRALYLAAFNKVREAISLDGLIPEDGARNALRVVAAHDAAVGRASLQVARCYTNDFARRAKERYRA